MGSLNVSIGVLNQAKDNVFNVFTDIAGFGERRGVHDGERHAQQPCQGLGQEGLTGSGGSDQQNVGFLKFDIRLLPRHFDPLVVVVNGNGQFLLGIVPVRRRTDRGMI